MKNNNLDWIEWICPLCGSKNLSTLYWFNTYQEHCVHCGETFEIQYEEREIWHVTSPNEPPLKIFSNINFNK